VGFELRLSHLFESHLHPIFALIILEMGGGSRYLPGLALNHDPPDLGLSSMENYKCLAHCKLLSAGKKVTR
jgi:hypothetical protein